MLRKFAVALLIVAAPAAAQEVPPEDQPDGEAITGPKPLPYKLKKVCRPQEVVGSSIPRMICSKKRVLLKPGEKPDSDSQDSQEPQS